RTAVRNARPLHPHPAPRRSSAAGTTSGVAPITSSPAPHDPTRIEATSTVGVRPGVWSPIHPTPIRAAMLATLPIASTTPAAELESSPSLTAGTKRVAAADDAAAAAPTPTVNTT